MRATRHVVQDLGTTKQSEGKEIGVCAKTKAEVKVEVEVEEEKVADRFVAAGQINQQLERQGQAPDQIFQVESVVARVEDGQISPIKRKKAHSTTNFFFKSKAKHVLSKVKTVLENVQHSTSRMEGFPVEDASNEAVVACATSGVGSPKNGQIEIDSSENDDDYRDDDDKVEIISKNDKETLILPGGDALGEEWQVDPLLLENTSQRTLVPSERLELCITVLDDFPYFEGDKYPHRYEYKLLSNEPFSKLYQKHCRDRKINFFATVPTFNKLRIYGSTTLASLGILSSGMTIVVYSEDDYKKKELFQRQQRESLYRLVSPSPFKATNSTDSQSKKTEQKTQISGKTIEGIENAGLLPGFTVKVRSEKTLSTISIQTSADETVLQVMEKVRVGLAAPLEVSLRLVFDGVSLDASQTIGEAGLEQDDMVDAFVM